MKIEIFVVRSDKENSIRLEFAKQDLIAEFEGLTIFPNLKGYWLKREKDKCPEICAENVETWLIYTRNLNIGQAKYLFRQIGVIKQATRQSVQLFSLNDYPIEI